MFADCKRRESRTEGKNRCMELRNKERGSKGEWGQAKMHEWKYRRSKVFSFFCRVPSNNCSLVWSQSTKSPKFEYSSLAENSSFI